MNQSHSVVILVNWRRWEDTALAVQSLLRQSLACYVIVCENGSLDSSASELIAWLSKLFFVKIRSEPFDGEKVLDFFESDLGRESLRVTLVISETNLGFAGGNNLAYRYRASTVNFEYVWFLNNDTVVEENTLSKLVEKMETDSSIGICGATLIYEQQRDRIQALGGARYWPRTGRLQEIGQGNNWPSKINEAAIEERLDYVSGASMFVRRDLLEKVGLMSEDYFLYFEELDWAVRARGAGYRLGYASEAIVFHKEGAALGSGKSQKRSALAEYYGLRNRLVFTRKFYPMSTVSVFIFSWLQVVRRLTQGRLANARMMAAVLLGLRNTPP